MAHDHQHVGHLHPGHGHGGSDHGANSASNRRALTITLGLVSVYMVAELVGGWLSNSLALLADAGHMFADVAALALALFAIWMAQRPATPDRTFGHYRAEILAALLNGVTLVVVALLILSEAWDRFRNPTEVEAPLMIAIATGGLVINLLGLWVLSGGRKGSLNMRGAWLHLLSDALGSVQAVLAGVLILKFGWLWVDPLASVLIALLVTVSAWTLLRDSVSVLMEGSPAHINVAEVHEALKEHPRVVDVHDLHVWTITSGLESLSAHVVVEPDPPAELLPALQDTLRDRFGIEHVTIQLELTECCVQEMPI
jgi:cobalt-zinc-cadmium efflux system protein